MGLTVRKSKDRGYFNHGWLQTYHTFSFSDYYDPKFMGFRTLRVINEDTVAPAQGFPLHPHKDMEILTYVIEGDLAHQDNTGSESVTREGEIQIMSAGTGIAHSEYNDSEDRPVHLLQIWILPDTQNLKPRYEQKKVTFHKGKWTLLVSPKEQEGSLVIHQDTEVYATHLEKGQEIEINLKPNRYGWLQVITGDLTADDVELSRGDGLAIEGVSTVKLKAKSPAHLLFFNLS